MYQIEQKSVVLFMRVTSLSKKATDHELVAVLQENAVSYLSATRFSKKAVLGLNSEDVSSSPNDDGLDEVKEVILLALSDEPFSSIQQIARRICVPKSIVSRRLADSLPFAIRHLHWVPHKLSDSQKATRVESSSRSDFAISCCPSGIRDGDTY
jgi:hypothetical protein